MFGAGTFTSQDKILPETYINFKSFGDGSISPDNKLTARVNDGVLTIDSPRLAPNAMYVDGDTLVIFSAAIASAPIVSRGTIKF